MKEVSMMGVLPPMKGLSYYCYALTQAVTKYVDVDFVAFKKLYPSIFYPAGYEDNSFKMQHNSRLKIRRTITYYNPISWIKAGFCKNKILHVQWWSSPTAPIIITILLAARLAGKKIVLTVHNAEPHEQSWLIRQANNLILTLPHKLIVHSQSNKDKIASFYKINAGKIEIVPHMIFEMYETTTREKALRELRISKASKVVLYFGLIREYKGINILIKAFHELKKKEPKAVLVIAGKLWIDWKPYQNLIDSLGLIDSVKLMLEYVPKDKVKYFFGAADLIVLPYRQFEAQSGVGSVALSYEKPMIVTNVGGLPEMVKDRRAVVEPGNENQLADAMVHALTNRNVLKKWQYDSKKLKKNFSLEEVGKQTVAVYKKLAIL